MVVLNQVAYEHEARDVNTL